MTTNKPKKVTKYRAHTTHGGGHRKKRRGAGNRGGRGWAGRGKKGKAKKQIFPTLGKYGFVPRSRTKKTKTLSLNRLQDLIKKGKLTAKDGLFDLTALGYHKLLSGGNITQPLKLKIHQSSQKAEEKVKAAGGSIISGKTPPKDSSEKPAPSPEKKESDATTNPPKSEE